MENKRIKHLVVDSGAFIKSSPVHEYAETIYTVNGVIREIRDKATLRRLQVLPYTLLVKEPSAESSKYVLEFSKKTGDYASLSAVDMQILALTYQLEKENVGTEHLNTEPTCQISGKTANEDNKINGFYIPTEKEVGSDGEEEEDEDTWLTEKNLHQARQQMEGLKLDSAATVACVTTDFCIQNVLIQMGLKVVSVDGLLIRQTKVYILRCFSCYKTTSIITKQFCPNCGNNTLKRVSVTVDEDGTKNIQINFKRPINIRGTRYSLPMPKGGKHSSNPIVAEDQPRPNDQPSKKALAKLDAFSPDYVTLGSPFACNDVSSRAASLGINKNTRQKNSRRNPNASLRPTGNRKK